MKSVAQTETKLRGRKRAAGEGTIYRRSDGLWRGELMVGYKPDGKKDVRTVTAKTQAECRRRLDSLKGQAAAGLLADSDKKRDTLDGFLTRWLEAVEGTVRGSTYDGYRVYVEKHLKPGLGRHRLGALRPDDIRRFYRAKLEAGRVRPGKGPAALSARTVHHLHAILHKALQDAVMWNYIPINPCDRVQPPSVPRREVEPPGADELGRLLDTADTAGDRLAALWAMAVYAGCRQGELLGLQWTDLDLDAGTLTVRRTLARIADGQPVYGEPKTNRSRRTIRIPAVAASTLRAHRDRQDFERRKLGEGWADYGLIFTSTIGTPLDKRNVTRFFKAALKRAGLSATVRFHDLRHAAATLMLLAGVDAKTASARLGHSTIAITLDLYTHAIRSLDDQAAERIAGALRRSSAG